MAALLVWVCFFIMIYIALKIVHTFFCLIFQDVLGYTPNKPFRERLEDYLRETRKVREQQSRK